MEGSGRYCSPPDAPRASWRLPDIRLGGPERTGVRPEASWVAAARRVRNGRRNRWAETPRRLSPAGAGQEKRRVFTHHDRPWTLTGAPGGPVGTPAPAAERAGNAEPVVVVPVAGGVPVAVRGAEVPRFVVPGTAAQHPPAGGRSGPRGRVEPLRPERWHGAGAKCSRVRRGRPMRPSAARPPRASPGPRASGRAGPAGGCGSGARSLRAGGAGHRAGGRSPETPPGSSVATTQVLRGCRRRAAAFQVAGNPVPPVVKLRRVIVEEGRSRPRSAGSPSPSALPSRSGPGRRGRGWRRTGWSGCRWAAPGGARRGVNRSSPG